MIGSYGLQSLDVLVLLLQKRGLVVLALSFFIFVLGLCPPCVGLSSSPLEGQAIPRLFLKVLAGCGASVVQALVVSIMVNVVGLSMSCGSFVAWLLVTISLVP